MSVDFHHRVPAPQTYVLARGPQVQLRPVRLRDLDSLRELAAKAGLVCDELELARLVRSDAGERLVLCATGLVDGAEALLGVGTIELGRSVTMPSMLLVDAQLTDGLHAVLAEALLVRARELAGPQVA